MISLYDRDRTSISKGALVELSLGLNAYRNDMVLVGGWAPYFLTYGHFDHCGSIDIDVVLRPNVMVRYESIRDIVVKGLGYRPTASRFSFEKQIVDKKGLPFSLKLDFLTEPQAAVDAGLVRVQQDLDAALIKGSSIAFVFNYEESVSGEIPGKGEASELVHVADIVSCMTMKGLALGRPNKLEKDSYDIYAVSGFHKGSPSHAVKEFNRVISDKADGHLPQATAQSLSRIYRGFENQNAYAAQAVARFMESDVSVDAQERIKVFREGVQSR